MTYTLQCYNLTLEEHIKYVLYHVPFSSYCYNMCHFHDSIVGVHNHYLMNDPEYYDEQGNSNSYENVDRQDQGVECGIPLHASTQNWWKSGQSKTTWIPSSEGHNHWQGW